MSTIKKIKVQNSKLLVRSEFDLCKAEKATLATRKASPGLGAVLADAQLSSSIDLHAKRVKVHNSIQLARRLPIF